MIEQKFLEMLACPACDERPPVRQVGQWIFCDQCHRAYPVREDIGPIMLIEEAIICNNGQPPTEPPK